MLVHYGYPDLGIYDEVVNGFELTGVVPHTPCHDITSKPAKLTVSELHSTSEASKQSVLRSIGSSGDSELDFEIYSKTLAERDSGWLAGPLAPSQLPSGSIINRRFGIVQGQGDSRKVRLIDDFSASGVNDTVQVSSAVKLHTLDVVGALGVELLRKFPDTPWKGKTVDLSSAYRQLGVSSNALRVSYIGVFNPTTRKVEVFSMQALPFGASRSVYGFLRVAHSLWWLGCKALNLVWSFFFDDYITLCKHGEEALVDGMVSQFFRLLGWAVSSNKDSPFSEVFKALGVEISFQHWSEGRILFQNTKKRVDDLVEVIEAILERKALPHKQALSVRGKLQFAKAQICGPAAKLGLTAITKHAYEFVDSSLDTHVAEHLLLFIESLKNGSPRVVSSRWESASYVFTDASFQPTDVDWPCGLGGVLYDSDGQQISCFSYCLSFEQLGMLGYPKRKVVIFEAELLAVVVAMILFGGELQHKPSVFYIDNNSTRDVAISGNSRSSPADSIVAQLLRTEDKLGILSWFSRVPSESNIADEPSRNDLSNMTGEILPKDLVGEAVNYVLKSLGKSLRAFHSG
eukprot:Skav210360  [mRNA]  locus=scaffold2370:122616:124334:- [translate_table: standard]